MMVQMSTRNETDLKRKTNHFEVANEIHTL